MMTILTRRAVFYLTTVLLCIVGLTWGVACVAEPFTLGISPSEDTTVCGCATPTVVITAEDKDFCCGVVCDGIQVNVQAPAGWEASEPDTSCGFSQTFTFTSGEPGNYTFSATATDSNSTSCDAEDDEDPEPVSVTITVKDEWKVEPQMTAPVISGADPELEVIPGAEVALAALAEDMDTKNCSRIAGGPIAYEWTCDSPSTFKNNQHNGASVTWVAPDVAGTYSITAKATDVDAAAHEGCDGGVTSTNDGSTEASISIRCRPVIIEWATGTPAAGEGGGTGGGSGGGGGTGGGGTVAGPAVIMTGGIQNDVHWAYLTAKVAPATAGGTVKFTIQGTTGVNTPARLSLNGGSGDNSVLAPVNGIGEAKAILTSSDKDMEEITVKVEYPNGGQAPSPKYITVQQATGDHPRPDGFVCDPEMLPVDGQSASTIRLCLVQEGTTIPVPGHHIRFVIDQVLDENNQPIRDAQGNLITGPPYGSIINADQITAADGTATSTFQAGAEPGTVLIRADDYNDLEVTND